MSAESPDLSTDAPAALLEAVCMWKTQRGTAYGVVEAAVEALVSGLDSPMLCQLAGATHTTAWHEVHDLWPQVAVELSLRDFDNESGDAHYFAARGFVRAAMRDGLPVRDVARLFHKEFHHGQDERIELLLELYDASAYENGPGDAEILAAMAQLLNGQ